VTEKVRMNVVDGRVTEKVRVKVVADSVNVTVLSGCRFVAFDDSPETAPITANRRITPNADRTFIPGRRRLRWFIYPISTNHMSLGTINYST
jgi:hypothetical protein